MVFASRRQAFLDVAAPSAADPPPDNLAALIKLAETLSAPATVKQRLAKDLLASQGDVGPR
jgi:hypothetical protein